MNKKALFLAFSVALACFSHVGAQTLSELRTSIRIALHDNPSDTARRIYSDTVLNTYINHAQREIVNVSWLADRSTSYALAPRTTYYSLPNDVNAIHQVYFTPQDGGTLMELNEVIQRSLYDQNPSWETSNGQPVEYYVSNSSQPQNQASAPLRISYIPIPTYSSTGTVIIWYYSQVPDLSADGDVPFENRRSLYDHHITIVYHVLSWLKQIEGDIEAASAYQARYTAALQLLQSKMGQAPNYFPSSPIPSTRR